VLVLGGVDSFFEYSSGSYICPASRCGTVRFANTKNCNRAGVVNIASKVCSVLIGELSNSLLAILEKDSLLNEISSD